jgi:UPF0755 protein
MDIKPPPKRPKPPIVPPTPPVEQPTEVSVDTPQPQVSKKRLPRKRLLTIVLAGVGALLLVASVATVTWYNWAISPRSDETHQVRVVVEPGDTAASIATTLYEHELINSRLAFSVYTQLSGTRNKLQAGGYVLSANQSVPSIVEHMTSGKTDEINLTILPGLTLDELRENFKRDGFSDEEVTAAYNATYDHPLLASRPAGATLEGYIYPETYRMNANQTLQELFERSFDEMYKNLQEKKYLEEFTKRGFTIHQGLTLASIIQKEVSVPSDQKQVAQVFYKRLSIDMALGADATFVYAAKQAGQEPTVSFESPYNTRKYPGLPPGPIANMTASALDATAFPAPGEYLFFVSGDDGTTHFSMTEEEHLQKTAQYCKRLCQGY